MAGEQPHLHKCMITIEKKMIKTSSIKTASDLAERVWKERRKEKLFFYFLQVCGAMEREVNSLVSAPKSKESPGKIQREIEEVSVKEHTHGCTPWFRKQGF